ncbi:hypothetical protein Q0N35_14170 [Priestia koreensis]
MLEFAILSDAVALGCLKRKVRDSCGISVTGETPQRSEEAHRTPPGKRSDLEWKSTDSVMNAILYGLFQRPLLKDFFFCVRSPAL